MLIKLDKNHCIRMNGIPRTIPPEAEGMVEEDANCVFKSSPRSWPVDSSALTPRMTITPLVALVG
ncbi:MAG: hypothetical protein ACK5WQ_08035, partial [Alphaproteobacteria bacterium]